MVATRIGRRASEDTHQQLRGTLRTNHACAANLPVGLTMLGRITSTISQRARRALRAIGVRNFCPVEDPA